MFRNVVIILTIVKIKDKDAQKLSREYWEEKKAAFDKDSFVASKLLYS